MDRVRMTFAIAVVVGFGVLAALLVSKADTTNQDEWKNLVYVFGAVEAIAFAAVGWVFGREVNRERAENAETSAEDAQEEAREERSKGAKLAGMVVAEGGPEQRRLEAQAGAPSTESSAVEYARRAYDL